MTLTWLIFLPEESLFFLSGETVISFPADFVEDPVEFFMLCSLLPVIFMIIAERLFMNQFDLLTGFENPI
jgi:hypothetical protein